MRDGDSDAFADAVLAFCDETSRVKIMGGRARERFEMHYECCQAIAAWKKRYWQKGQARMKSAHLGARNEDAHVLRI